MNEQFVMKALVIEEKLQSFNLVQDVLFDQSDEIREVAERMSVVHAFREAYASRMFNVEFRIWLGDNKRYSIPILVKIDPLRELLVTQSEWKQTIQVFTQVPNADGWVEVKNRQESFSGITCDTLMEIAKQIELVAMGKKAISLKSLEGSAL